MKWKRFWEIGWLTGGTVLIALGLDMFLVPNKIAAGGVSGMATVLHYTLGLPVGMTMLALNVPLFIMGIYRLGLSFGLRSLYGTVALSVLVDLMAPFLPVPTYDMLLATLYGGVLCGLGLGLVFRYRGTTGGTDLAAAILRTYTGVNIGQLLFLIDASVVVTAGITFRSWELSMYALVTIFITAWVIDLVQEGVSYAKAFLIFSERVDEIVPVVLNELNRGITALHGRGLYTGKERDVLLVVVNRSEVSRLKEIVYEIDRRAFVVLTDVREVLGEGFKEFRSR